MPSRVSWWWILVLALLLLAPGPAGRLLLDVVGGVTLLLFALPLALGGAGWLAWVLLQRRMRTCPACGFRSLGTEVCPACGTVFPTTEIDSGGFGSPAVPQQSFDVRDVTIDVSATDVEQDG
ncbi:MAG: hypothetical protein FJ060_07965 [Cyanobacteria bacterium K_Offshore_0m_m2_072]|nr:hypothetical protein [Cyanobacteria bacterium K_Offshore_0m_m2_072]